MKRSLGALLVAALVVAACGGTTGTPTNDIYRHVPGQDDLRPAPF
jgi:ABC-type glycerol-3-phosphate transport system substrate-binding protein